MYLTCVMFSGRDSLCHQGTRAASLEGEMPASFSSSGNTLKYSQTLQARRLNLSVDGRFGGNTQHWSVRCGMSEEHDHNWIP